MNKNDNSYEKIYTVIEKMQNIGNGDNAIYHENINKAESLIELGDILLKIIFGYWIYENYNLIKINTYELQKLFSKHEENIRNAVYNDYLRFHIYKRLSSKFFSLSQHNKNVYVLLAMTYIKYGFRFSYNYMQEYINNEIIDDIKYFSKRNEKMTIDDNLSLCVENIAKIYNLGKYYNKAKIAEAITFNKMNEPWNGILAYMGMCIFDLLAFNYITKTHIFSNINEMLKIKSIVLNPVEIDRKLPGNTCKFINKNILYAVNENRRMHELKEAHIFNPYFNVTAVRCIMAVYFTEYIANNDYSKMIICDNIFNRFANLELCTWFRNANLSYKIYMFYLSKTYGFKFEERICKYRSGHEYNLILETLNSITKQIIVVKSRKLKGGYNKAIKTLSTQILKTSFFTKEAFAYLGTKENNSYVVTMENNKETNNNETSENEYNNKNNKTNYNKITKINMHDNDIDFSKKENILYIMKRTSVCQSRNHTVLSVTGILKNLRGFSVRINVNYCENCKKFFINRIDFDEFCKRHGIMLGNFSVKELNFSKGFSGRYKLADESPLHYCGYNVNKQKGLTESDRHKILANIIDFNIMKKTEIIEYLHFYINNIGNRANMNLAVSKWEDDLYFVNNYRINKQKSYRIDKIRQ